VLIEQQSSPVHDLEELLVNVNGMRIGREVWKAQGRSTGTDRIRQRMSA
jgi:hypothetical protein